MVETIHEALDAKALLPKLPLQVGVIGFLVRLEVDVVQDLPTA
jgi:hypothetical protein